MSSTDLVIDSEEQALLTAINAYRASKGLAPLAFSVSLNRSSAWMSRDMASKAYFSHTDSLGRDIGTRMNDCGYTNPFTWRGENIAAGYQTATQVLQAWQGSPGHNGLMLDPKYVAAGIGRVQDFNSPYTWYWTLDAASWLDASPASNPGPTPSSPATATSVPAAATATKTSIPATPVPTNTPVPTAVPPSAGSPGSGAERLLDTGFETALSGPWTRPDWFASLAAVETSVVHSGSAAFSFHGKGSGPYIQQTVVAHAESLTVSGWVNVPTRNSGLSGAIELVPINTNNGMGTPYTAYNFKSTTPGWVHFSYTSPVLPGNTGGAMLRIRFPQLDGTVYVDDLSVH